MGHTAAAPQGEEGGGGGRQGKVWEFNEPEVRVCQCGIRGEHVWSFSIALSSEQ